MIPAGTAIVCPKCKRKVGRTMKSLDLGQYILGGDLFLLKPIGAGEELKSFCCSRPLVYQGSLSTENGWMPPQPLDAEPE